MSAEFPHVDLLVVGAGVIGLSHAAAALKRGMSVAVIERDDRCVGASIRNFGHITITAQTGRALEFARSGRDLWLSAARQSGFWLAESGTVVVARADDEAAVLEELAAARGSDEVRLIDAVDVGRWVPDYDPSIVRAAHLPLDLRVDSREAIPSFSRWLARQGVTFHWSTTVGVAADGVVETSRGPMSADQVIVCVGQDLDRLAPDIAKEFEIQQCYLQMLEVEPPSDGALEPAMLSGLSMLRYPAMQACPSAALVRHRIESQSPEFLDHGINLMVTRRPNGSLILGDSHHYDRTPDPFDAEHVSELLLREGSRLLGVERLRVINRWRGVYSSSTKTAFVVSRVDQSTTYVSVTSGMGMTVGMPLAAEVIGDL